MLSSSLELIIGGVVGGEGREGNGTPFQYSCLESPMERRAWWAAVHGVTKSQTRLSDFTFTFHFHALGEGNANLLQCSCLENPRDRGAWWAAIYGVAQSQTLLTRLSSSSRGRGWRRQWYPTPVLLPGKSHGRRSLVGCSPWGHEESDTTKQLYFHFSLSCIGEGNGNPLQCFCLENPRDRGAWWAAIYGVTQSQT